ncbi:family 78 glycoside hydrolase catalytic domain [Plebeiibacterium sediminum]|uniref:alpha-L-rhamnosidase n=1 Tax=Plebeiibacterium sediminum TaxID=2992112 RepID=A0AAE3M280_9BACT|nr:family 78 glycoside hydrolase catalytic domain [Plebeiobacterium sediminum]MCW3785936.1 glycoside hydrolase family 78 protein [Plebeiobacterium sediminum]
MSTKKAIGILIVVLNLISFSSCTKEKIAVKEILCENKVNPQGVDVQNIHFSWKMISYERSKSQSAYQIIIASDLNNLNSYNGDIWNTGKVQSDQSILVKYDAEKLTPGTKYFWKVKVWDESDNESRWSGTGDFVTGLISESDWSGAKWIAYDELDSANRIVPGIHAPNYSKEWKHKPLGQHVLPIIRTEFNIDKEIESAYAFISGLGHYEMDLNGNKVGNRFLAPGWTNYDDYCFYNTYDITENLNSGANAIGVWLGNGFYNIPNSRYRKLLTAYGNPKMMCKILVNYTDGSSESIVSNENWKTDASPITFSSIYAGEDYNACLEQEGWNKPGFDDSSWKNVVVTTAPNHHIIAEMDYPVAIEETIAVDTVFEVKTEQGGYLYDFGQNASGIVELTVKGNKGDTIKLYPSELINEDNKAVQGATGKPYYFTYILKGNEVETWKPRFTFYGFRYVQVEGATPQKMAKENTTEIIDLKLLHNRNSAPEVGTFNTSFELFNKVNSLIKWAIKSNLQSVATDCPHREKLGWLEQSFLMGGGIHYNYDVYHLYCKIIDDMISAQTADGLVPTIAPEYTVFDFANGDFRDSPEWGSASVILPWLMYKWYGDKTQMDKAWPMMTQYVDYLKSKSVNHILDFGLGDWYDLGPNSPGYAQLTPRSLTATAIYYYDVKLLCEMAELTNKKEESKYYGDWANEIKQVFNSTFFDAETNIYSTGSQTAIAMPLVIGLVDDAKKDAVFKTLIVSINNGNKDLTAGDIGFHYLVKALQNGDAGNLLFDMNARDDVPGYGFQLKKGATALTESWQALERVSNNHLMLGHIMEWFYGGLGGIEQTDNSIAYKEVKIAPQFAGNISSTETSYESPYGTIKSAWNITEHQTELNVSVPVNSTAVVYFPADKKDTILENGNSIDTSKDIEVLGYEKGKIKIKVGSGEYTFTK